MRLELTRVGLLVELAKAEIIKISQSSHKMYSNNIVNFQESTTILNACTKTVWELKVFLIEWFQVLLSNTSNQFNCSRLFAQ